MKFQRRRRTAATTPGLITTPVKAVISIAIWGLAAAASVLATPITVVNYSFETDDLADGINLNVVPPDWSVSGAGGASYLDRNPDGGANAFNLQIDPTPDPLDAEQVAWSNGGDLYQVLGATLAANTLYTLTVDVGDRTNLNAPAEAIRLGTGATYGVNLLPGNVVSNTTPLNGAGANDGWELWISTFSTGIAPVGEGDPLRVELVSGGVQVLFDNVRLDATLIPEPASGVLFLAGLAGLASLRRRR